MMIVVKSVQQNGLPDDKDTFRKIFEELKSSNLIINKVSFDILNKLKTHLINTL